MWWKVLRRRAWSLSALAAAAVAAATVAAAALALAAAAIALAAAAIALAADVTQALTRMPGVQSSKPKLQRGKLLSENHLVGWKQPVRTTCE